MIAEFHLGGILMAPFVPYALLALLPYGLARTLLDRSGILGRVWHPALFEVSLYAAVLSLLVILA